MFAAYMPCIGRLGVAEGVWASLRSVGKHRSGEGEGEGGPAEAESRAKVGVDVVADGLIDSYLTTLRYHGDVGHCIDATTR
jgi:hypothetical protein